MAESESPKPGYLWAMLNLKCPRCRRGNMFEHPNPYRKFSVDYMLSMHDECPVCHQKYQLETGFWYGTGYVSYALTVVFSGLSFFIWWLLFGFSLDDDRLIYWLITNGVLMIGLQPYLMRLSRWIFLNFFVRYDENYEKNDAVKFN